MKTYSVQQIGVPILPSDDFITVLLKRIAMLRDSFSLGLITTSNPQEVTINVVGLCTIYIVGCHTIYIVGHCTISTIIGLRTIYIIGLCAINFGQCVPTNFVGLCVPFFIIPGPLYHSFYN